MAGSVPTIPLSATTATLARRPLTVGGVVGIITRMWQVRRERRALMALDDRMLKDIGLGRGDVARETSRSVWDLPHRTGRAG
jgi:uncharacterized protein YjiS (DUF1127 family)